MLVSTELKENEMLSFNPSVNEKNYSFLIENTSNKSVPLKAGACRELLWSKEGVLWDFLVICSCF